MVYDPNAIDTPQYINVSVQVGSGVPPLLDFSVTPGQLRPPRCIGHGQHGGDQDCHRQQRRLVLRYAVGRHPLSPTIPYTVTASAGAMAAGDYSGTLAISGSPVVGPEQRASP
jgi:hypothetical protein